MRPSTLLDLNRLAIEGIEREAGSFRTEDMGITGSRHRPPPWREVPRLIDDMCDYVNDHWDSANPVHLAAYVLWKLNWIHPFVDGNGRTARVSSYLVLNVRLGYRLPGAYTIPDQISVNKGPYYRALEAADRAHEDNRVDLSDLETLLMETLANQLAKIVETASGRTLE